MPKMTKRQFEEMFREDVLPHVIDRYEQDGIPDRPARREAWNDTVDGYIRDRTLPEAAGNWSHPRWLETWSPPRRHHAAMAGGKKSPAQLDAEINEILTHGVDTVQPRRLAGQPLPARRPAAAPHGVDTVLPRRLAGQPSPASRIAQPTHGVDTVLPRRLMGQSPPQRSAPAPHGVDTVLPRRLMGQSPVTSSKGKRSHATVKIDDTPSSSGGHPSKEKLQQAAKWIRRELTKRYDGSHPSHLASKVLEEADQKFGLGSYGVEGWAKSPRLGYQYLNYGDSYDPTIVVRSNPTSANVIVALGGWASYAG